MSRGRNRSAASGASYLNGIINEIKRCRMLASSWRMKIPMAAAVLAGGGSRRMGVPKASLPYGKTTLLAHQTERLSKMFEEVLVVAKEAPAFDAGPSRLVLDRTSHHAPIHGLPRSIEEVFFFF